MERVPNAFAAAYVGAVQARLLRFIVPDAGHLNIDGEPVGTLTLNPDPPEVIEYATAGWSSFIVGVDTGGRQPDITVARRIELRDGLAYLRNHTSADLPVARRVLGAKRYELPCLLNNHHGQALSMHTPCKLGYAMGVVKTCDETIDPTLRGVTLEEITTVQQLAYASGQVPDREWWCR